jgi:sugar/nucleoside kinase (ribokinase family)
MDVIVFGNVTLDIICFPVNDVPRHESVSFDQVEVSPGGCASNVAIGLAALGVPTALVAQTGDDDQADLLHRYWENLGVETCFVKRNPNLPTAVSIGLVDSNFQPRFVHTPGANGELGVEALDIPELAAAGALHLHVAGFFVLPSLLDEGLAQIMAQAQRLGLQTSLDVVFHARMDDPNLRASLWGAMPHIDYFVCNAYEAFRMTGEQDPDKAARQLKEHGAGNVIIKLGEKGCLIEGDSYVGRIPAPKAEVVDTTGAGDAFAAGFIAALNRGADFVPAIEAGNKAGARIVEKLGAIQAWLD